LAVGGEDTTENRVRDLIRDTLSKVDD
jgi:dynein heavy chain